MNELTMAAFLSLVNKTIVDYIAAPIKKKFPGVDLWWLPYVALVTGGVLGWVSGINLFLSVVPTLEPLAGQILTSVLVGGGSSLIYDVFDRG